jgi:hypothetical protein
VKWLGATALVVLASRTLAYALEPSPLARALQQQAGGPRLWTLTLVALLLGLGAAAALVWLAAIGVEERGRLEPLAQVPARPRLGRLLRRAAGLSVASMLSFALLESTIHWEEGLGWHGLSCLTGPVHRDAIPILVALSLVAVAVVTAAEHVVAWMRRTLARLAAVRPPARVPQLRAEPLHLLPAAPQRRVAARGPPVVAR